jgi:hypothetical protein
LNQGLILLSIAPLPEQGTLSLTVESHLVYFESTLKYYDKAVKENVIFLCSDNCSTNRCLATLANKPFVGCASHRLNLAVKAMYKHLDTDSVNPTTAAVEQEAIIKRIHRLMMHLCHLNPRNRLHEETPLAPIKRNETRRSSTYFMLKRYLRLYQFLDPRDDKLDISQFVLTNGQDNEIKLMVEQLEFVQDVTVIMLQGANCREYNLSTSRTFFDTILEHYQNPECLTEYLFPEANIIHSKHFENGVVKIMRDNANLLTRQEENAVTGLKKPEPDVIVAEEDDVNLTLAQKTLKRAKHEQERKRVVTDPYGDLSWIPHTSNVCERLFSKAKSTLGYLRRSMTPLHFEQLIMLKANRHLWNANVVHAAMKDRVEEETKDDNEYEEDDDDICY